MQLLAPSRPDAQPRAPPGPGSHGSRRDAVACRLTGAGLRLRPPAAAAAALARAGRPPPTTTAGAASQSGANTVRGRGPRHYPPPPVPMTYFRFRRPGSRKPPRGGLRFLRPARPRPRRRDFRGAGICTARALASTLPRTPRRPHLGLFVRSSAYGHGGPGRAFAPVVTITTARKIIRPNYTLSVI